MKDQKEGVHMKACMVVTNGFEEVETVGTYAILRRGGVDVQIYSLKGDAAVGRFGLTCADLHSMDALHPQDFDALILPGGPQYEELENSTSCTRSDQDLCRRGTLCLCTVRQSDDFRTCRLLERKTVHLLYIDERGFWRHLCGSVCS